MAERTTITPEERDELATLIAQARAANAIAERLTRLAEDITGDDEMNSWTFDACNNDADMTVDDLLAKLGVEVVASTLQDADGDDAPETESIQPPAGHLPTN